MSRSRTDRDFVEDLLLKIAWSMVFGPPGAGKTFLVLDLLLHVALGRTWFGRAIDQGPALLFALEGRRGVERRIVAFRQHYRLVRQDLPFAGQLRPGRPAATTASVDNVIAAIKAQGRGVGDAGQGRGDRHAGVGARRRATRTPRR